MVSSEKAVAPLNYIRRQVHGEGSVDFSDIKQMVDVNLQLLWVNKNYPLTYLRTVSELENNLRSPEISI